MNRLTRLNYSDVMGVTASGLCAIHCAITPFLFASKPLLEFALVDHAHNHGPGVWQYLDYFFLVVSFFAVLFSTSLTHLNKIKWMLWGGWFIFSFGLLSEALHIHGGIWMMYLGSFILVIAHLYNHRRCRNVKVSVVKE